jgi:diadenosine tetraphosphatase ApaH/serine/threonine PP2A family protein phosphatase
MLASSRRQRPRETNPRSGVPGLIAFISDLHSNMEAIRAVLDHIAAQKIQRIICLGDVIGYGPEPVAALRLVKEWEACLRGNHEEALLYIAEDFNEKARAALDWTRDRLNDESLPRDERYGFWSIIADVMRETIRLEDALLVHGSPRDPIREYMLPRDVQNPTKMKQVFDKMDRPMCFVGHSHVPGVYAESGGFISPPQMEGQAYRVAKGQKHLVNVGSVGQPRDGDNRACYATWDGETVRFHRVEYDYATTMKKIYESGGLPRYLADRLKVGR